MIRFDMPPGTWAKLAKVTPRKETHGGGKQLVQAVSLRFAMECEGALLNVLHPGLQDTLLMVAPGTETQEQLDGVPAVKSVVRCPLIKQPHTLPSIKLTGYTLSIEHGIGDDLELYVCALDKFEVEVKQGGGAVIRWSVASNKEITREMIGELCDLEGSEVRFELRGPAPGEAIDGTQEAFDRDHPGEDGDDREAGDLFAEAHGDTEDEPA